MVKCDSMHKQDFIDHLKKWKSDLYPLATTLFISGMEHTIDTLIKEIEEGKHDYKFKVFNR